MFSEYNLVRKNEMKLEERFSYLKNQFFENDDRACFIERERILAHLDKKMATYYEYDREAKIFAEVLDGLSTPIDDQDFILGRMVEALPDPGMGPSKRIRYFYGEEACLRDYPKDTSVTFPNPLLYSFGHMCYNWEMLLTEGCSGILDRIEKNAKRKGDPLSQLYLLNAKIIIDAIRRFAMRYADAAEIKGMSRQAEALRRIPFEPAYDLFSALQSIWFIHMLASCVEGARDFAFGHFDKYIYPFYIQELENGTSREEIISMLRFFLLKPNEITGRAVYNIAEKKPIPCYNTKQYIIIGGAFQTDLSTDVLKAFTMNDMPEPVMTLFYQTEHDETFKAQIFESMNAVADKIQVYNYDLVRTAMEKRGMSEDQIDMITYSGCCSTEMSFYNTRNEYYLNIPKVVLGAIGVYDDKAPGYDNLEQILDRFGDLCYECFQEYIDYIIRLYGKVYNRQRGVLDALFIANCVNECRYPGEGGAYPVKLYNFFLMGLATGANSIAGIDKLVFKEKRYTLEQLRQILLDNYEGNELLRLELKNMAKFGNDDDQADSYAVSVANAMFDAIDKVKKPDQAFIIGDIYSLDRSAIYGKDLEATPDGRHAGEYISENQSPSYGTSLEGATAELRSLAKLPFVRSGGGGYNLSLSKRIPTETLRALVESYFELGGLHVGLTYVNKEMLQDAMVNPEKYDDLTVRLYGYSEFFTKIPRWQQVEYLERTAK
jgi:formate C-acetyltransferase